MKLFQIINLIFGIIGAIGVIIQIKNSFEQKQKMGVSYAVYPVFTTDETLLTRAEAYTLLKDYDAATSDIAAWIHNFTSSNAEVTQERIQDFYGSMDYWDPYETQNVSVKKRLSPNFTLDNEQENRICQSVSGKKTKDGTNNKRNLYRFQ